MLRLYTDESPGLKVDPVVVLVLSVGFIMSVVALHSKSQYSPLSRTETNKRPQSLLKSQRSSPHKLSNWLGIGQVIAQQFLQLEERTE